MYSRLCRIKPKKLAIIIGFGSAIIMKKSLKNYCLPLDELSDEELEKFEKSLLYKDYVEGLKIPDNIKYMSCASEDNIPLSVSEISPTSTISESIENEINKQHIIYQEQQIIELQKKLQLSEDRFHTTLLLSIGFLIGAIIF